MKHTKIHATVVIPTFERPSSLIQVLLGLNEQTVLSQMEVIVVDDGSRTRTKKLIEELDLKYPWRYYWQVNDGFRAAKARNTGILFAKGELIIMIDDDILVPKNFVEAHLNFHQEYPETVCLGFRNRLSYSHWSKGLEKVKLGSINKGLVFDQRPNIFRKTHKWKREPWAYFSTSHISASKEALIFAGLFDENFCGWGFEDTELGYRLSLIGMNFQPLYEPIPFHLEPENDDMTQKRSIHLLSDKKYREYLIGKDYFLAKYDNEPVIRQVIEYDLRKKKNARNRRLIDFSELPIEKGNFKFRRSSNISLLTPYEEKGGKLGGTQKGVLRRFSHATSSGISALINAFSSLGVYLLIAYRILANLIIVVIASPFLMILSLLLFVSLIISPNRRKIFL